MRMNRVEMDVTDHAGAAQRAWPRDWGRMLLVVGAMLAAACASTSQGDPASVTPETVVVGAPPPPPNAAVVAMASSDMAPALAHGGGTSSAPAQNQPEAIVSMGRRTAEPPVPPAESRPGLATEWGETRVSPIEDVAFERADETRPLATTELRYNDERGVAALAAYLENRHPRAHETSAAWGAISIWLKDGNDRPLDFVQTKARTFVVGEAGERYTLVLENHTSHRFEAVATVDGLDVMNGTPGSVSNRGYVLMPNATVEIDGFRDSKRTVAAFRFGRIGDSYAAKLGDARDVGVIGIAFFGEEGDHWTPWTDSELKRRTAANPFPGDGPSGTRFATPPR